MPKRYVEKLVKQLHALARISIYMEPEKLIKLMKTSAVSQFSYCSLIWMFHDRILNKKMSRIHEKKNIRMAYKDDVSTFCKIVGNG